MKTHYSTTETKLMSASTRLKQRQKVMDKTYATMKKAKFVDLAEE